MFMYRVVQKNGYPVLFLE